MKLRNLSICTFIGILLATGFAHAEELPLDLPMANALYLNAAGGDAATGFIKVDNPASGFIFTDPTNIEWVFQPKTDGTLRVTKFADMPSAVGTFTASGAWRDVRGVIAYTFTRATTRTYLEIGTGLSKISAVGVESTEAAGVMLEKAVTNYCFWSDNLAYGTPWGVGTGLDAPIANQDYARYGTLTAAKLVPTNTSGNLYQAVVPGGTINGLTWTLSVDLRADVDHTAKIYTEARDINNAYLESAFSTVSVTSTLTRFSTSLNVTNASAVKFLVRIYPDSVAGTNHVYASAVDITQTRVPFRHIPTTWPATTKALDAMRVTNTSKLADAAGSVIMTYSPLSASTESSLNTLVAGPGNGLLYREGASIKSDDGTSVLDLPATWSAEQPLRITLTWGVNGRKLYIGTGSSATAAYDGSFGLGSTIDFYQGASAPNGNLKDVKFWYGKKLSDSEVTAWQ